MPLRGHVFISYSRSETPLVQDLAEQLAERHGVPTWLDFRNLEPGKPWDAQLEAAIDDAFAVIVVVSQRSVSGSQNVRAEWGRALAAGKRVVLALAERAELPEPLRGLEWVDLRSGWSAQVGCLASVLRRSPQPPEPIPDSEKIPTIVRVGQRLGQILALLSLPSFWTVALPLVLLPLPARILKREFDYVTVRTALLFVPFGSALFPFGDGAGEVEGLVRGVMLGGTSVLSLLTFFVIRSRSFRRWMKPAAARPLEPMIGVVVDREPQPVRYGIDAVSEDHLHVMELVKGLKPFHGTPIPLEEKPDLVFRFVSNFHDTTDIDPQTLTLPILVSDPDDELPRELGRVQWIDFRRGGDWRRKEIECIARLLDQPRELLRRIGVAPPHGQRMMPRGVQVLNVVLWACLMSVTGGLVARLISLGRGQAWIPLPLAVALAAPVVALAAFMLPRLRYRRPTPFRLLYMPALLAAMLVAIVLPLFWVDELPSNVAIGDVVGFFGLFPPTVALFFTMFLAERDLERWLPTREHTQDTGPGTLTQMQRNRSLGSRFGKILREARDDTLGRPSRSA